MDLTATYDRINSQNHNPRSQPDCLRSDLYTRAIWTLGKWSNTDFLDEIKKGLGTRGVVFNNIDARLHFTLLQFQTFPIDPNQITYNDTNIVPKIQAVLNRYPPLHITFRGVARSRFGLFLCGYPNYNVNQLRNELRAICIDELVEPHPQDIYHSTLFRFTEEPTKEDILWLDSFVLKYKNVELCTMRPDTWEFGYGTWTQKNRERIIKSQWNAKPPLWILHRGLMNGPDKTLENKESELWKRLQDGWDIEIDLWYKNNVIWLGHDEPTDLLQDKRLLNSNRVWIHCKNIEMLQYMTEQRPGAPFFSHNVDEAVLTSNGYIWCYPGFQAGIHSIIVMPERVPSIQFDSSTIGGICSDYTS